MTDFQRGFVPIELDRTRLLRFTMKETWLLVQRYGDDFLQQLYKKAPGRTFGVELKDPEVMKGFLLIGLSADAEAHGETLTLDQIDAMVTPVRFTVTFSALLLALFPTHTVPQGNGKAGGAQVEEPAGEAEKPLPSTLRKRKAGQSRRSVSHRKPSGR